MSDYTPAIKKALAEYHIAYTNIGEPQKGYRNSSYNISTLNGELNFIMYKNEPAMRERVIRTNRIGDFLHERGLPARHTADTRILQLTSTRQTRYAALYNYLPGHTLPWETYTMDHIKTLGRTMAEMHAKLAGYNSPLPLITDELNALNKRMRRYFADTNVTQALKTKLGVRTVGPDSAKLLEHLASIPKHQALHMDFVRGNILFEGTQVSGILDFEKAAYGPKVCDIARTLAFLLVDCKHKTPEQTYRYFLQSGYIKHGGGDIGVRPQILNALVSFFLWHDFYKFLRHNPYEALPQNEHFVRTQSMLLKRGLISYA